MPRARRFASLFIVSGLAISCGGGGNNDNGGNGGASSTTSSSAKTTTSAGGSTSKTSSTSSSSASSSSASSSAMQSSSSGMPAMGDPCRGTPLPDGQFYVPTGMCARVVVNSAQGSLRQLTFAPNGDLFGVTAGGSIKLFHDANADGVFDDSEVTEYANTGGNGNNCHIDAVGGYLYAGSPNGVKRWPYAPGMTSGGQGEDVVVNQPGDGNHPKHTVHVYGNYLYVHSGSHDNASDPLAPTFDNQRALLRRFDLSMFNSATPFDWTKDGEVFSDGIRNMVGYKQNAAGKMFGVVNGLDDVHYQGEDVHQDNPGEIMLELGMGKHFGYPMCYTAQRVVVNGSVVPAGTQLVNQDFPVNGVDDNWCAANSVKPVTFFQAHSAPLDIEFFDDDPVGNLPEMYRGGAFVALHGSWDRSMATGYKVIWVPFDSSWEPQMPTSDTMTTTFPYQTIFGGGSSSGPQDGPWQWNNGSIGESVRPVSVAISPVDGALYISSDSSGYVYRVGIQH